MNYLLEKRTKTTAFVLQAFITDCFWLLFALPSPKQRYLPKCKSQASRSAVYDLLVELVKRNVENYDHLHKMVLKQHSKGTSMESKK